MEREEGAETTRAAEGTAATDEGADEMEEPRCFGCGRKAKDAGNTKLLVCSACNTVSYCTRECQRASWKAHKPLCKVHANNFPNGASDVIFVILRDRAFGAYFSLFHHQYQAQSGVVVADLSHRFTDFSLPRDPFASEHRAINLSFVEEEGFGELGAELDQIAGEEAGSNETLLASALDAVNALRRDQPPKQQAYNSLFVMVLRNLEGVSFNLMCSYIENDHPALSNLPPEIAVVMDWDDPLPVLSEFVDPRVYKVCIEKMVDREDGSRDVVPPLALPHPSIPSLVGLPQPRGAGMAAVSLGSIPTEMSVDGSVEGADRSPTHRGGPMTNNNLGSPQRRGHRRALSTDSTGAAGSPLNFDNYGSLERRRHERNSSEVPDSPMPQLSPFQMCPPDRDRSAGLPSMSLARHGRQGSIDLAMMAPLPGAYVGDDRPGRMGHGDAPDSPLMMCTSPVPQPGQQPALQTKHMRTASRELTRMQIPSAFANVETIADVRVISGGSPEPASVSPARGHRRLGSREFIRFQLGEEIAAGAAPPMMTLNQQQQQNLQSPAMRHRRLGSIDLDRLTLPVRREQPYRVEDAPESPIMHDMSPMPSTSHGGHHRRGPSMEVLRLQLDPGNLGGAITPSPTPSDRLPASIFYHSSHASRQDSDFSVNSNTDQDIFE